MYKYISPSVYVYLSNIFLTQQKLFGLGSAFAANTTLFSAHQSTLCWQGLLLSCCHNVDLNKCTSQHSKFCDLTMMCPENKTTLAYSIPDLVKMLAVPPEKRIHYDCKLITDALYVFSSSIAPFKKGLCVRWCFYTHSFITLPLCVPAPPMFYILNLRRIYEVGCDWSSQTRWDTDCVWTSIKQCFEKVCYSNFYTCSFTLFH